MEQEFKYNNKYMNKKELYNMKQTEYYKKYKKQLKYYYENKTKRLEYMEEYRKKHKLHNNVLKTNLLKIKIQYGLFIINFD